MPRLIPVRLFCEDVAHERMVDSLVRRVAVEEGVAVEVRSVSSRGGHGRALAELAALCATTRRTPDFLVACIDANCRGWHEARQDVENVASAARFAPRAIACPDQHIERWYLADPEALGKALGAHVTLERRKCDRDRYKKILLDAWRRAGHWAPLGGAEFAREIVAAMDLLRAGKNEPSLKHFVDDLRSAMRNLKGE